MAKLKITGSSDAGRGGDVGEFEVDLNPEKVSFSFSVPMAQSNKPIGNTTSQTDQVSTADNITANLEFVLDDTGAVEEKSGNVPDQIKKLRDIVVKTNPESHRTNYLTVSWGKTFDEFKCALSQMSIDFTLFKSTGDPLRARVRLSLVQHEDPANSPNTSRSPDMSRLVTVRVGDSLPHLCKQFYGKPYLYPKIAEINGLLNFRQLEVGSQIYFPPLER